MSLLGLAVFTVGLALFVFPGPVAGAAAGRVGLEAGHRGRVGVRAVGLGLAVVGFWAVLR